jgi:hypothetical protein
LARPHKAGIDYFPLDTSFDDSIELLKLEFGSRAVGVLISLYQKIYFSGYYTFWDDDIQMLFARSACEEKELIAKILERAMERGIFERILYETYNIITSVGIQQEYLRICRQSKRKQITLVKEYCLVTDPDLLAAVTEMQSLAGLPAEKQDTPPEDTPVKQPKTTTLKQESKDTEAHGPALQAALHLRDKIRKNNPRAIVPGNDPQDPLLAKWTSELNLMHRKGPPGAKTAEKRGYSWQEILNLIDYCQDDNFWAAHILCPADLRKKAVTLETKLRRSTDYGNNRNRENEKRDMAGKFRQFVG